ncbi:hypothetical protein AWC05_07705 [Mycobacterium florentinum]|uniref:Phage capsid-like C-terminal domain-containing protein n=1 Tax=Mycobacterium florentinum TaxID=292462 RepID=A0A1X1TUX8_MYCFL|nr:phage major capsid protein [Mycobacterium florentinum]MCV7408781.1 phage major capsid protein [Mycobacterium florentinum]ORV48387.1 hypothetical protein AWC05_07705 [Mycobacterium florentinum]
MTKTIWLNKESTITRMEEISARLEQLAATPTLSRVAGIEADELGKEFDTLTRHIEKLDRDAVLAGAIAGAARGDGSLRLERGSPSESQLGGGSERHNGSQTAALRRLERSVKAGLPARSAEVVERLVSAGPESGAEWVARWVVDTGSDAYRSAFAKLVFHGESRAGLEWTAEERAAYDRVARLRQEQRAASLSDAAGGFLVPYELDPTVILTSAGSENSLLQISRVVSTVTDVWHGVTSLGVQSSWDAEASEVSDDSPAFTEPSIPAYKSATFVPFSIEVSQDAPTLLGELGRLMADSQLQLLNEALTNGSGTGSPTGIVTALTGGSSVVATATADTITAADVYKLQNTLGPRWQANARWCANLGVLNLLRAMETSNGALLFPELRATVPTLLGKPVAELSNMSAALGGGAGNNPVLLYGDFRNFVVSQRIGSAVELIPHLLGANMRPTGQRGLYSYARWGSDSVNDAAFRLLVA